MYRVRGALIACLFSSVAIANSVYRYQGPNGEVIFSDRKLDNPAYTLISHSRNGAHLGKLSTPASQPSRHQLDRMIVATARRYQLDPELLAAIVEVESNYQSNALSPAGAVGLMQLMPDTASDYAIAELFDVESNLDAGARHLLNLFEEFEELDLVLAAYNAGAGNVRRYGGVPPFAETQRYVQKIKRVLGEGR